MIDLIEIKSLILNDIIDKRAEKKIKQRINYENYKQKNKEKKRLIIEQIKKERQENSLIFNQF
jgi:hypothetical protein